MVARNTFASLQSVARRLPLLRQWYQMWLINSKSRAFNANALRVLEPVHGSLRQPVVFILNCKLALIFSWMLTMRGTAMSL